MVTLSGGPSPAPYRERRLAEGFGHDAEAYDRARPRYPQAVADAIVAQLPGPRVLDVGIGTGLSALPFRSAGCTVTGVEPDERMAAIARRRGFTVEAARFEHWDPAGRRVDGVVSGQTWHWVDPVAGAVQASRVLVPGGCLALFWNAGDPPPDIGAAFAQVYRTVETGLPFTPGATGVTAAEGYGRLLDAATTGIRQTTAFTEPVRFRVDWKATITRDQWLAQVPTSGGHQLIPADKLKQLLDGMAAVIDGAGGAFTMNYATVGVATTCVP